MPSEIIRFEDYELDPAAFELRRAGSVVRLERIPFQLLLHLAQCRERVVTREEILEAVWGRNVFVDADNSINTAVRKIRQALKDDPDNPRFLRTVPGKGYRFSAEVAADPPAAPPPLQELADPPPSGAAAAGKRMPGWIIFGALAAVLIVAALVARPHVLRPASATSPKIMIVVLPFLNLSNDPQEDFFVDGMTEEKITQLGSLDPQRLGVIARTSSMQYKGAHKSADQIARELGVKYLLEGSVRREGERVRVTAQLIQASDQTHVWAGDFDRDQSGVLKLQSDVALAISSKIDLTLSPPERARLAEAPALNAPAHEAYLQGLHDLDLRTKPAVVRAIAEFQHSIALDPNYAPAHAALARTYGLASVVGAMSSMESMPEAREAALRSIALDPSLSAGHSSLAFVKAHYEFDWPGAEREYLRALDLNPNDAYAHVFYSNSYLSPRGRHAEAIDEMQKAIAIDPFSAPVESFLGRTYIWSREYDKAMAQLRKCAEMFPGFAIDHERMAQLHAFTGRFDDTIAEDTKARLLSGEDQKSVLQKEAELRRAWTTGGPQGYWNKVLEFTQRPDNPPETYGSPFGTAILYAQLREKDKALECLEKAYEQRSLFMTEIAIEPAFDSLRPDPRFQDLLHRVGLN
jgi:TolB-like protein/DNA-binding winged helix-turn-helix (wHTH) protein/Tfp pilus assembly protein PilF